MKYLFILFCSITLLLPVYANDGIILGEKIYFTTDRGIYSPGDAVSLCGILSDENVFGSTHYSNYVNIELINETDSVISRYKVPVREGIFKCVIPLDIMLYQGIYYLRGYTELMRNFRPESFPIKPLFIGEAPRINSYAGNPVSVQFYPESGNWVADHLQGMVFSVKDKNGFPLKTSACLMHDADTIVSEIHSNSNGLGVFYLMPEQGVQYMLHFKNETGLDQISYQIPETGKYPSFRVAVNDNRLSYSLHMADKDDNKTYNFFIWYRGECLAEHIVNAKKTEGVFLLPDNIEGIIACILTGGQGTILAERLIYQQVPSEKIVFEKQLQQSYKAGEMITFRVKKEEGTPLISRIESLSHEVPDYMRASLPASFLLTSDVSTSVYASDSYFEDNAHTGDMDLLLRTLRWGRYYWQDVFADTFRYAYPPEEVLALRGSVKHSGNKPLKEGRVICFNNATGYSYDCDIQQDGSFVMGLDDYDDSCSFFIQPYDKRGNSEGLIIEFEEKGNPLVVNPVKDNVLTQETWVDLGEQQVFKSYYESRGNRVVQMPEVTVKARLRTAPIPTEQYYGNKYVESKDLNSYTDMGQVIGSRFPVLAVVEYENGNRLEDPYVCLKNKGVSTLSGRDNLVLLLDDKVVGGGYVFNIMNIREVESISLLSPAQALAYAPFAMNGALSIKTKGFKSEFKPMGVIYKPVGLSSAEGFNDKIINITTGKEPVSLIVPEEAGEYHLILEGITGDGRPFSHTYPFSVE